MNNQVTTPQVTVPGVGTVPINVAETKYNYSGQGVYNGGGPVIQGDPTTAIPNIPQSPIAVDGLTSPASNPLPAVTPPSTQVANHNVTAPVGTTTDANGQATPTPTTTPEKSLFQKAIEKVNGFGNQLGLKSQVTADLQKETDLANKTTQATQDYNAYTQKKLQYNQQIEAMRSQNTGGTLGGQNQAIEDFSRKANADLANLAIQAQSSQGLLSAAQQTIKDKLEAQFQPIQDQVDFYAKFIQLNQNDLSEKEKFDLTKAQDQKKADLASITKTADDLHQSLLQNKAPQTVYSNIDKVISDYTSGKITAADAQSKMYQAAGDYGIDESKKLQQDKLRLEISNGNGGVTSDQSKANITADAEDILSGRNTLYNIRLQMGRTKDAASYMLALRNEIRKSDSKFDFVASDAGGKFVSSEYFQKSLASINSVMPNIDKIVELSDQVGRIGVKGVDALLQKTAIQLGNKKVSNFHEAQKLIGDEIGLALGNGTVSDMKLQLGFDVTDPNVTPEVFASNMGVVKEFLNNRKAGLQAQRYASPTTQNSSKTVQSNGQDYVVGQVYEDASKSKWTIDSQGKWSKQ